MKACECGSKNITLVSDRDIDETWYRYQCSNCGQTTLFGEKQYAKKKWNSLMTCLMGRINGTP
jgi:hypothetical protein